MEGREYVCTEKNTGKVGILIKGKIHQDYASFLIIYAPNVIAPTFTKGILLKLKSHIKIHTIVKDFNTQLFRHPDRPSRQN